MISISLTSGMLPRSFLSASPSSADVSTSGTSSGGSFHAAFPAEDFSKIRPSFWLTWRLAFLLTGFIAPPLPHRTLLCWTEPTVRLPPLDPLQHRWHRESSVPCSTTAQHCPAPGKTSLAAVHRPLCVPEGVH